MAKLVQSANILSTPLKSDTSTDSKLKATLIKLFIIKHFLCQTSHIKIFILLQISSICPISATKDVSNLEGSKAAKYEQTYNNNLLLYL